MRPNSPILTLVSLPLTLLTGSCTSTPGPPSANPSAAVVTMRFHSFDPPSLTIDAGGTVDWQNASFIWHTVTADAALAKDPAHVALPPGATPFHSGRVDPGHNYQHQFPVPGTYRYVCQPHEMSGMLGEIIVRSPAGPAPN